VAVARRPRVRRWLGSSQPTASSDDVAWAVHRPEGLRIRSQDDRRHCQSAPAAAPSHHLDDVRILDGQVVATPP
jgi:hypothetical protein